MTASFPNSVKDFSDKENGKKIYAAHVNELQDEVEAIETTLLAGTEGQVLTAGTGGVPGWETPSGGGGASFAFDGVTFTDMGSEEGARLINIILTLNGSPISNRAYFFGFFRSKDNLMWNNLIAAGLTIDSQDGLYYHRMTPQSENSLWGFRYEPSIPDNLLVVDYVYSDTIKFCILLPSGAIAESHDLVFPIPEE